MSLQSLFQPWAQRDLLFFQVLFRITRKCYRKNSQAQAPSSSSVGAGSDAWTYPQPLPGRPRGRAAFQGRRSCWDSGSSHEGTPHLSLLKGQVPLTKPRQRNRSEIVKGSKKDIKSEDGHQKDAAEKAEDGKEGDAGFKHEVSQPAAPNFSE